MDLRETGWGGVCTGCIWLRIGTSGRPLTTWYEPSVSTKGRESLVWVTVSFSRRTLLHGVVWLFGWLVNYLVVVHPVLYLHPCIPLFDKCSPSGTIHSSDIKFTRNVYEGVSKTFRTCHLERELQMVQLSATRCNFISILWVSLVTFAAITLCVASERVFIVVSVYFVIGSVRKLLDTPSYNIMSYTAIYPYSFSNPQKYIITNFLNNSQLRIFFFVFTWHPCVSEERYMMLGMLVEVWKLWRGKRIYIIH
jgi:hypothetical protein